MPAAYQERITRILLVEDNKIDARLTSQAIHLIADWPSIVDIVDDGEKAIGFLSRRRDDVTAEIPNLVILDLNLPKFDGIEVLRYIRADEYLRELIVFIFSSSTVEGAQHRMRGAHVQADGYFEKPSQARTYFSIAEEFRQRYERAGVSGAGAAA